MYAYIKKKDRKKIVITTGLVLLLMASLVTLMLYRNNNQPTSPVLKEKEELVISLPNEKEVIMNPFLVDAKVVLEYFDGSDHEIKDFTNLEGVYRPNQGIDYDYNDENFDVVSMFSGEVSEVKSDALFGNSVSIKSGDLIVTYQSLNATTLKVNDSIKQKDIIGKASANVYNPELGNHLHIVVTKNGKLIDPKTIIGKSINEIK